MNHETRSTPPCRCQLDASTEALAGHATERQPESAVHVGAGVAARRQAAAVEQRVADRRRKPGTIVRYRDVALFPVALAFDLDAAARRGVAAGVDEQVCDDSAHEHLVELDARRR